VAKISFMKDHRENPNKKLTEFLLYKSPNGKIKVDVLIQNESSREMER